MLKRKAVGVAEPIQRVRIDEIELAVSRVGPRIQCPTIVCLHAIGHGGGDFEAFIALNRHKFDILTIDWPGQGQSESDSCEATSSRYAALLELLLESMNIANPVIIGCSMGGTVAIRYATRNPTKGIVLCNSGGLIPNSRFTNLFCRVMAIFFKAGMKGRFWYPFVFRLYYQMLLPSKSAAVQRQRIIESWQEIAPVLFQAWSDFATKDNDLCEVACQLETPILVAWSMQDRVLPFALNRRLNPKV